MSALYIHIPFCKKACHYCDFHFSTNFSQKEALVKAICVEISLQKDYLKNTNLSSVYFGGGTPSVLSEKELGQIFEAISTYFLIEKNAEITFEANPDDISLENLRLWKQTGINRLSVGIQSFHEPFLQWTNRNHTAQQAENCIKDAQNKGFSEISLDLMYGFPAQNHDIWLQDLQKATALEIPHISAYCLTIEEKTTFGKWLKQRKIEPIEEDFAGQQLDILIQFLTENKYEHYEISNFCKKNHYAKHNTNYWLGGEYLGIGASAHSYNHVSRQYNVANNTLYIKNIQTNKIPFELEILTPKDLYNEYLLTRLRTHWGIEIATLQDNFKEFWGNTQEKILENYVKSDFLIQKNGIIFLTQKGKMIADTIIEDFFN